MMRSLLAYYADVMSVAARGAGCAMGCSGHGDCHNGTCLCEIRYTGEECAGHNMPYHACIGGIFLLVAFICAVQLTICIVTEYRKLKAPSFLRACKVTTQKMLYFVAFLAALIRGAYFVSPSAFEEGWATSLLSAYYPLLLSGSSLIVCFWAEVFHLRDIRWERPRFLSKSFLAFVTFNLISYTLLAAEVLTTNIGDQAQKTFYQHVFNGCYAVLLFIVVIFFLIYGVEVYFKVRGEFLKETKVYTIISKADDRDEARDTLVTKQGVQTELSPAHCVNQSQLQQSRVGLVSQALMLILIAGLLASETLSELWKSKVPVVSRNWHDLVFRLAEIGVALWFPCVLWNCMAPERLWILNPRRLLAKQIDDAKLASLHATQKNVETDSLVSGSSGADCWICYDASRPEPLIKPCRCSGDVAAVHHHCLRRWLVECAASPDGLKCKVCNTPYIVQKTESTRWSGNFRATTLVFCLGCGISALAMWVCLKKLPGDVSRPILGAVALLLIIATHFYIKNLTTCHRKAKVSSLRITEPHNSPNDQLLTISKTVTVDMPHKSDKSKEEK